jgi:hypothetical protein
MHLATILTPRAFLGKAARGDWANALADIIAVERPIRTDEDRPIEIRYDLRRAFPGIDPPSRPEPGLE